MKWETYILVLLVKYFRLVDSCLDLPEMAIDELDKGPKQWGCLGAKDSKFLKTLCYTNKLRYYKLNDSSYVGKYFLFNLKVRSCKD